MKKNKKVTSVNKALGMIKTKKRVSKREYKKAIAEGVVKKFRKRPLNVVDLDSDFDVKKIMRSLKRPKGKAYMLNLIGKGAGPKDLSENKHKYIYG